MTAPGSTNGADDHPAIPGTEPDAPAEDGVDESSEESFPSSDPPERGGPSMARRG